MKSSFLNIHNFLKVQINQAQEHEFIKDINHPFSYFEVELVEHPDIILNVGDFEPQNSGCSVVDHKCHIKKDYIYSSEKIDKIPMRIEINGLDSSPTVINVHMGKRRFRQHLFPSLLAQNIILRPIIDFKLLQQRVLSIHAAGAAGPHGALILPGRGGAFKTTVMMDLIRELGYKFLGDDRIIIFRSTAYSYPIHQKLFYFRVSEMKSEEFGPLDKFKYVLYQARKHETAKLILESAPLWKIYCMVKWTGIGVGTQMFENNELVRRITKSHQMENIISPKIMGVSTGKVYEYFAAYSFIFPESKIASYWNDYAELVAQNLAGTEFTEISLPQTYTPGIFADLVETLGLNRNLE